MVEWLNDGMVEWLNPRPKGTFGTTRWLLRMMRPGTRASTQSTLIHLCLPYRYLFLPSLDGSIDSYHPKARLFAFRFSLFTCQKIHGRLAASASFFPVIVSPYLPNPFFLVPELSTI